LKEQFHVQSGSVASFLRKPPPTPAFDIVFLDPPWDAADEYALTLNLLGGDARLLNADAVVIAEHRRKLALELRYGHLERTRLLEQGDAALSFYALATNADRDEPPLIR
jgi:16S rRNA G966 N2-methylase RsmD